MIYPVTIAPRKWRKIIRDEMVRNRVCQRDLISRTKLAHVIRTRHAVFRRLHDELGIGAYAIARELGFHHTTVYHALGMLPSKRKAA